MRSIRTLDVTSLSSWLAVRTIDRETRRLDAIERGEPPPVETPFAPPPTAALPSPAMPNTLRPGQPLSDVPLPGHEPRRPLPKTVAPRPPAAPAPPVVSQQAAPLPPPIEVRPAPAPPKPKATAAPAAGADPAFEPVTCRSAAPKLQSRNRFLIGFYWSTDRAFRGACKLTSR